MSGKKIPLLVKTSGSFLRISLILVVISTVALYFYVRYLLQAEVEEELHSTEARIESSIAGNNIIYQLPPWSEVSEVDKAGMEILKDTLIYDPSQDELEEFRELTTYSDINGREYRITVRALVVESENILIAVVISYIIIILLVFIFLFYMNKARNRQIWRPFFETLDTIKQFSLTSEAPINLVDSNIREFSDLNKEISTLTDKVRSDYKNLKQYTEDVSHEMQTPLAIIQAKIENIINGDNLNNIQFAHLTGIQGDIHRLTQLNKRLTLLTKIENQQFGKPEVLQFTEVIKNRIDCLKEIYPDLIQLEEKDQCELKMDPYLADVLCDNLLSNAIKYSNAKGSILVRVGNMKLTVSNIGTEKLQSPEKLFSRFYRESGIPKSTGLGLAIVKKICDHYGFMPHYAFEEGRHHFKVKFSQS